MKLSIVIVSPNTAALLERCLMSLAGQMGSSDTEVIVVSNYDGAAAMVAARFPHVRCLPMPPHTTVPELRAEGIRHSHGAIVALAEDHGYFGEGWCDAVTEAHEGPHAIIGGVVENDPAQAPLDWAVYFYDYSKYMLPQMAGPVETLSGNNVSYKRTLLDAERDSQRGCWLVRKPSAAGQPARQVVLRDLGFGRSERLARQNSGARMPLHQRGVPVAEHRLPAGASREGDGRRESVAFVPDRAGIRGGARRVRIARAAFPAGLSSVVSTPVAAR